MNAHSFVRDSVTPRLEVQAVVIGAGPAGAAAAIELARHQVDVLLVDQHRFPRMKTCGGCINAVALRHLEALLPSEQIQQAGAVPLHTFTWSSGSRQASVALPGGVALTRATLDSLLWNEAAQRSVRCRDLVRASLAEDHADGFHTVKLKPVREGSQAGSPLEEGCEILVRTRVVIVAAGLAGQQLQVAGGETTSTPSFAASAHSLVGVGCVLPDSGHLVEAGTIAMSSGDTGYVGLARAERNQLVVAAAIAPDALGETGPPQACARILRDAARHSSGPASQLDEILARIDQAQWRGTPPLTRRRRHVASDGIFYVGDAAGYVEPFTGEGIQWALESGRYVVPFVLQSLTAPTAVRPNASSVTPTAASDFAASPEYGWQTRHRQLVGQHHRRCRWLTGALRRRWSRQLLHTAASRFPRATSRAVRYLLYGQPPLLNTSG